MSRTDGQFESRSTSTKQKMYYVELGHKKTLRYISDRHQPERRTDRQTGVPHNIHVDCLHALFSFNTPFPTLLI